MLGDEGFLTYVIYGGTTGLSMSAVFLFVRWIANFIAGRWDKKEEQIDGATRRLIEGLERRLNEEQQTRRQIEQEMREELRQVRRELAECIKKHSESDARVLQLEAAQTGLGDAKQHAALIVAAERLDSKIEKELK